MSELLVLTREGRRLNDGELRLLLLYRSYESPGSGATPGDEVVADQLGVDVRTVKRRRAALIEKGFLSQQLRGPKPAEYRAIIPSKEGTQMAHHPPKKRGRGCPLRTEEGTQGGTQEGTSVSRASKDEDGEDGEDGTSCSVSSLRSSTGASGAASDVGNSSGNVNGGGSQGDADSPWNARLAPIARQLGRTEQNVVGLLGWARRDLRRRPPADQAARVEEIAAFWAETLRQQEAGAFSGWIEPGDPVSVRVFAMDRGGQPLEKKMLHAAWTRASRNGRCASGGLEPIEAVGYSAEQRGGKGT